MDLLGIGTGIASLAGGVYDTYVQQKTAKENLKFQRENLDYQKAMQKEAWRREDSSSQRKMADLRAAGLNPLLASGMQAQSSSPIRTEAPQMQQIKPAATIASGAIEAMNMLSMKASIEKTFAETQRIKAEAQFLEKTQDYRISQESWKTQNLDLLNTQMQEQLETMGWQKLSAYYDKEVKRLNTEWTPYMKHVEADQATANLSKTEKELLAKKIAIDEATYNLEKYKTFGVPTNYTGTGVGKDILGLGWLAQELMDKAKGGQ